MNSSNASRRLFLKQSAAFSALGTGAPLAMGLAAMGSAVAQTASDYKALVCIFLHGGNDSFNTVIATDTPSWSAYSAVRNQAPTSIALAAGSILPLQPTSGLPAGRSLGLHPQLGGVQNLFNTQRRVAIVSNVGPLIEPLTKDDYQRQAKRYPSKLFSHNDQQSTWQALAPEGAALGWGGKLADALASSNGNAAFTGISTAGNAVWVSGKEVKQYQLQPTGVARLGVTSGATGVDQLYGSDRAAQALKNIMGAKSSSVFSGDIADLSRRTMATDRIMSTALPDASAFGGSAALLYTKPSGGQALNPLAQQLQAVARSVAARNTLGMTRQVFFVSIGGFDTHDDQNSRHTDLMAKLNHAMVYFDSVINGMGMGNNVTTFTASDFGRTFTSNGDGTDHGWGGHHFVMGGAVQGGTIAGELPIYGNKNANNNQFDSSPDQINNGALLPKISVEQYGAALGQWFGAGSVVSSVFPNLKNFSGGPTFMR